MSVRRKLIVLKRIYRFPDGQICIVICDIFMRRIHQNLPQSGDICLVDATANLDRNDSKLFHLIVPSPIGGLPLGNLITTREDQKTITFGLNLLKSVLPDYAFYGRGRNIGPSLFITDDSAPERQSLHTAW